MPYGPAEMFLVAEAKELVRQGCDLTIIPRSPASGQVINKDALELEAISLSRPLFSAEILWAALREIMRSPIACFRAFAAIAASRSLAVFLKNLVVYPKGLWLGRFVRTTDFDHIHAHWAFDHGHDSNGGERGVGGYVELHRPQRRHSRRQLIGAQGPTGFVREVHIQERAGDG